MVENVKPEVIKKTQDLLMPYFNKPPLTVKLLKKPPFRFLQDIILSVIKTTGFLNGVFTDEELNPDNVKNRNMKINFLNKLIYVVESTTGNHLSIKTSKIIAGLEPTKTNELLQLIGKAIQQQLSGDTAIQKYNTILSINNNHFISIVNNFTNQVMDKLNSENAKTNDKVCEMSGKIKEPEKLKSLNNLKAYHHKTDQEVYGYDIDRILDSSKLECIKNKHNSNIRNENSLIGIKKETIIYNSLELKSKKQENDFSNSNSIISTSVDPNMTTNSVQNFQGVKKKKKKIIQTFCEEKYKQNEPMCERNMLIYNTNEKKNFSKLNYNTNTAETNTNLNKGNNFDSTKNKDNFVIIEQMKSQQLYDTNYLNQEQGSLVAQILETQKNLTNSINLDITSRVIKKVREKFIDKN